MRFLRIVIVVWLLLTALIVVARLFRNTNVEANVLSQLGFGICNGQPCFLGIVPGITTGQQAYELLSQYDDLLPYTKGQTTITARVNNIGFKLTLNFQTEQIISIEIPVDPHNKFSRLDSFIAIYGEPCAVKSYSDSQRLELNYPNMVIGVQEVQGRLSSHSELLYIVFKGTLFSTNNCAYYEGDNRVMPDYRVRPWLGFTFASRYKYS